MNSGFINVVSFAPASCTRVAWGCYSARFLPDWTWGSVHTEKWEPSNETFPHAGDGWSRVAVDLHCFVVRLGSWPANRHHLGGCHVRAAQDFPRQPEDSGQRR